MSEWKCGGCGVVYSFEEFIALDKIQVVADDPDPIKNYGYTSVCVCGYRFHLDKWFMRSTGTISHYVTVLHNLLNVCSLGKLCKPHEIKVDISTADLELNRGMPGKGDLYYESMIFLSRRGGEAECHYQERYPGKEWASADHQHLRYQLERGKYLITYRWDDYGRKFVWVFDLSEEHNRIIPKSELQGDIVTESPEPTFAHQQMLREDSKEEREEMKKGIEELTKALGR